MGGGRWSHALQRGGSDLDAAATGPQRADAGRRQAQRHRDQHERAAGTGAAVDALVELAEQHRGQEDEHVVGRVNQDGRLQPAGAPRRQRHGCPEDEVVRDEPRVARQVGQREEG
ncbi:hypothetical protein QMG83_04370 [Salinibacterium sp. G-O1]|uniref:hypothetical protein n=1 Tax=Salinibacterium sp. G-O1 TaxID=3046208 RepID=UPI0024BB1FFF|nr:hypothetical protein [Salinibacterium sp. G-O1]MDJ0334452.1 hypothetical protein [Salinibacterium sp. G-O1]